MTAVETTREAREPVGPDEPDAEFEALATAVDAAAGAVAGLDEPARSAATDLRMAIEAFHRPALVHIVRTLRDDPRGKELLFDLVDDPNVRAVLGLHGIIRADPATRARRALDAVRPYLQSHGGDVELVRVEGGTAYVRLHGSCNGCSMSAATLREGVEEALIGHVEEIERVEQLDDQPTVAFIPLDQIGRKRDTGWVRGMSIDEIPPGEMRRIDVTPDDGEPHSFVVTNVEQSLTVFRNACVHQGMTLDGGMLDEGVLTCPWHGFRFDASTGECLSAPGAQLTQVPTRIEDGHVWIRAAGA